MVEKTIGGRTAAEIIERRRAIEERWANSRAKEAALARDQAELAYVAKIILKDVPSGSRSFDAEIKDLVRKSNGNRIVTEIIEVGITLNKPGSNETHEYDLAEDVIDIEIIELETTSNDPIATAKPVFGKRTSGYLFALTGTDCLIPTGKHFVRGVAAVGHPGGERFVRVGVLENGTVFATP